MDDIAAENFILPVTISKVLGSLTIGVLQPGQSCSIEIDLPNFQTKEVAPPPFLTVTVGGHFCSDDLLTLRDMSFSSSSNTTFQGIHRSVSVDDDLRKKTMDFENLDFEVDPVTWLESFDNYYFPSYDKNDDDDYINSFNVPQGPISSDFLRAVSGQGDNLLSVFDPAFENYSLSLPEFAKDNWALIGKHCKLSHRNHSIILAHGKQDMGAVVTKNPFPQSYLVSKSWQITASMNLSSSVDFIIMGLATPASMDRFTKASVNETDGSNTTNGIILQIITQFSSGPCQGFKVSLNY